MAILATKLFCPPPRSALVARPRLLARLNAGLHRKLTLISAPAGFGKTTLLSSWLAQSGRASAWLALDRNDRDPVRFLSYLIAALQTQAPHIGQSALAALRSPQPPAPSDIITAILNDLARLEQPLILVLDDYHLLDSQVLDAALDFLIGHLPPLLHLVIATREDPDLALARLRARDQITELRALELRFTPVESTTFLNDVMDLALTPAETQTLDQRTEGWVAGLQLAALSLRHSTDPAQFIRSFSGSHRFVLDYLLEEVLEQQPAPVQDFLLHTAILTRMCAPLCAAVLNTVGGNSQALLEQLERANLFIIPLDHERHWYRYHHLFADLLRQRLEQQPALVTALHHRASIWLEAHGLELEAFEHAIAAHDLDRAARLAEGNGMPLLFRGATAPIMAWLDALPAAELDARPALRVMHASALLFANQLEGVPERIRLAEAALQMAPDTPALRNQYGHLELMRATLAVAHHDAAAIVQHAERALELLAPANVPVRTAATWALGYAHQLHGRRQAAMQAYRSAVVTSTAIGHYIIQILATLGMGHIERTANQLSAAAEHYQRALELMGTMPLSLACEPLLGLAKIEYLRNDLAAAQEYGQRSVVLARNFPSTDRTTQCLVALATIRLAYHDLAGAAALLADAASAAANLPPQPALVGAQVALLLRQERLEAASELANSLPLPLVQARVALARQAPAAALDLLRPALDEASALQWPDIQLEGYVLLAQAELALANRAAARQHLEAALALAASTGNVRSLIDAGAALIPLLREAAERGTLTREGQRALEQLHIAAPVLGEQPLIEPLTVREHEVLRLIAQGLSNQQIGDRLVLALDTVKGHNRNIFSKLQVRRRTEAIARARELGLI